MKNTLLTLLLMFSLSVHEVNGQSTTDVRTMSRSQLRALTQEQLLDLSMDDLLYVAGYFGVSIDDLLEDPTTASSKTALGTRETPGIITVLTTKDIESSGARDLADLLKTIPGIYFGYDIDGVRGIFMRGNWGHEGKVLFLIDDIELNEDMYSVFELFNHIPASQISRIEVVRGPGSALYGGYAELGVIKISTFKGSEISSTSIGATAGTLGKGINSYSATFNTAADVGNTNLSLMGSYSSEDAARGMFTDFYGDSYDLQKGWLRSGNLFLNMKFNWKELEVQGIYDDYKIIPTGYANQTSNRFRSFLSQVRYTIPVGNTLTITPSVIFKNQLPYWFENTNEEDFWFYKRTSNHLNGNIDMIWSPAGRFSLISGTGYRLNNAAISHEEQKLVGETFSNDSYTLNHHTFYLYSQGNLNTTIGNFFAGARAEEHSVTGLNIAPRLGYTHVINRFNIKYLYSHAFRSPSIENVNLNPSIEIEKTVVNELALGYRINNHFFVSTNLYDIVIKDPIVYLYDYDTDEENYFNDLQTGTTGVETEIRAVYTRWNAAISWSWFDASKNNLSQVYKVILPGGEMPALMKGAPMHMVHFQSSFNLWNNLSISPVLSWYSERFGYIDSADEQSKANPYLIADLNLFLRDFWIKDFTVGLSGRNLLNAEYGYIQPLAVEGSAEKPFPGRPVEVFLTVKYKF